MFRKLLLALFFGAWLACPGNGEACTAAAMKTMDGGLALKVIGGSDKVEASQAPGGKDMAFTLELLAPYSVICEEDKFYKVTDSVADTVEQAEKGRVGYVSKDQVYPWPTREALVFGDRMRISDRPGIIAWDDDDALHKLANPPSPKLAFPDYIEDTRSTLARDRAARPYPVLSSRTASLLDKTETRVFRILLPVALPSEQKILDRAMTSATFVVVFNAVDGMAPFAAQIAQDFKTAFESLPPEIQKATRIGFVFFRTGADDEKYVVVEPQSVADAVNALASAARPDYMRGGGGAPQPLLDAVYIAQHFYPWGVGRRVMVVVGHADAKPATSGELRFLPQDLDSSTIARELLGDGIGVVTVQSGPKATPDLVSVLSTLAGDARGTFVGWGSGGDDDRRKAMTAALAAQLTSTAEKTYIEGNKDLKLLEFDHGGYGAIPLAVRRGEKLQALRDQAAGFNIDPAKSGVLVREALIQNGGLLPKQVQMDRKALERLIALFAALGRTDLAAPERKAGIAAALTDIAGTDPDPGQNVGALIRKHLGFEPTTSLLDASLETLAAAESSEQQLRIRQFQSGRQSLQQLLDTHSAEFDRNPVVWIPGEHLP
jgi:hypothetical protein